MTGSLSARRGFLAGVAAVFTAAALPAFAQSVSGVYRAEGRNPDGSSYTGTVQIQDSGGSVQMQWSIAGQSYSGNGSRNGDVVWVDWGQTHPVVYVRMPSGELHGTWANGRALERLIP
ncbi:MAG: hypothetical protein AB3N24_10380 [Leisingera sp.]